MATKLEKLNLSNEELDRFKKAMDDPAFRDLLREYTDEISNPANRAEHEAYLREVEERARNDPNAKEGDYSGIEGVSIPKGMKLVSPTPVFCLKVVIPANAKRKVPDKSKVSRPEEKIFINLCTCDAMDDVSSQKVKDGKKPGSSQPVVGEQFSLPYSLTGPRDTKDSKGNSCKVYDFTFSEATWNQYRAHMRIVHMFQEMAVEAIEEREGLELGVVDKNDGVIILKNTSFKGGKPPPRLFKISEDKMKEMKEKKLSTTPKVEEVKSNEASKSDLKQVSSRSTNDATPTPKPDPRATPSYTLTHRGYFELSQTLSSSPSTGNDAEEFQRGLCSGRPKELVLKVDLPKIEKIAEVNLDQAPNQVLLTSIQYYLLLPLPYPVLTEQSQAKWSGKLKQLTVTMPVDKPSKEEEEKYRRQRQGYDAAVRRKKEEEKQEEEQERKRAQEEEQEQQRQAEETRKARAAALARDVELAADASRAAAIAAAAASSSRSDSRSPSLPSSSPLAIKTPSPPSSQPAHSVLKNASPSLGSSPPVDKKVRFSFSTAETSAGIPERDGPLGPKPVSKMLVEELAGPLPSKGKGHKRKHIPGIEGPEAWTGVGKEPSKEIQQCFPQRISLSPASAGGGKQEPLIWPSYTYSQSPVSVVIVIKVKGIRADSVKLVTSEVEIPHATDGSIQTRTNVDLYFATTDGGKRKQYRLFLPLAYPIQKSSYDVTAKNMLLNFVKVQAPLGEKQEWASLLDYSTLGEFDSEGTPLSSPAVSPMPRPNQHLQSAMDELSLGPTKEQAMREEQAPRDQENAEEASTSNDDLPAPAVTMKPIALSSASMLNPFVASYAAPSASNPFAASATNTTAFVPPSNSLLFQLD